MCASVVASCDTPPVFEFREEVLDLVSSFVCGFAINDCFFAIFFGGMHGVISCSSSILRILLLSYPRSAIRVFAFGKPLSKTSAPLKSLRCPSVRCSRTGRPRLSHRACSFVFNPPLVRPISLGSSPPFSGWRRCDGPSGGWRRSSKRCHRRPAAWPVPRRCARTRRFLTIA